MRYIVNSREMNLYDSRTIEEFHMPQAVLMERAAFSFVETLRREKRNTSRTLVVCGSGNNGGDGLVMARAAAQDGWRVVVLLAEGDPKTPDAMTNYARLADLPVTKCRDASAGKRRIRAGRRSAQRHQHRYG